MTTPRNNVNPTRVDGSLGRRTKRRVAKLLKEWDATYGVRNSCQPAQRIFEAVMATGVTWDYVLLALSNLCMTQYSRMGKGKKNWYRRAVLLHKAMEFERSRKKARREMEEQS